LEFEYAEALRAGGVNDSRSFGPADFELRRCVHPSGWVCRRGPESVRSMVWGRKHQRFMEFEVRVALRSFRRRDSRGRGARCSRGHLGVEPMEARCWGPSGFVAPRLQRQSSRGSRGVERRGSRAEVSRPFGALGTEALESRCRSEVEPLRGFGLYWVMVWPVSSGPQDRALRGSGLQSGARRHRGSTSKYWEGSKSSGRSAVSETRASGLGLRTRWRRSDRSSGGARVVEGAGGQRQE